MTNAHTDANGFLVIKPGVLSLIQDLGRVGHHNIGLSSGGPMDEWAFKLANQICENDFNASAIEVTVGGLVLKSQVNTLLCVTGAEVPFTINGEKKCLWRSHIVVPGDRVELGFAQSGCRSYLAVRGGFTVTKQFSSTSTVVREAIGGLNGNALGEQDFIPCSEKIFTCCRQLAEHCKPVYLSEIILRIVVGYQHLSFSDSQLQIFFNSTYEVTNQSDRMGYRLQGKATRSSLSGVLSEGNCYGAVQFPPDGQPIVLLNDRQTIGGYPKLGAVIAQDCSKLAQLNVGAKVSFIAVTQHEAVLLFHDAQKRFGKNQFATIT